MTATLLVGDEGRIEAAEEKEQHSQSQLTQHHTEPEQHNQIIATGHRSGFRVIGSGRCALVIQQLSHASHVQTVHLRLPRRHAQPHPASLLTCRPAPSMVTHCASTH